MRRCLACIPVLLLLAVAGPAAAEDASASLLGFELRSLEAPEYHSLERYRGKPVLMVFFQPDCTWCQRQFRAINELAETCDYAFEAMAVGFRGNRGELRKELRRLRPEFPAYQASPALMDSIGSIDATPLILIGDSSGKLVTWLRGYIPSDELVVSLQQAGTLACT